MSVDPNPPALPLCSVSRCAIHDMIFFLEPWQQDVDSASSHPLRSVTAAAVPPPGRRNRKFGLWVLECRSEGIAHVQTESTMVEFSPLPVLFVASVVSSSWPSGDEGGGATPMFDDEEKVAIFRSRLLSVQIRTHIVDSALFLSGGFGYIELDRQQCRVSLVLRELLFRWRGWGKSGWEQPRTLTCHLGEEREYGVLASRFTDRRLTPGRA